jgi:hypothetical protein
VFRVQYSVKFWWSAHASTTIVMAFEPHCRHGERVAVWWHLETRRYGSEGERRGVQCVVSNHHSCANRSRSSTNTCCKLAHALWLPRAVWTGIPCRNTSRRFSIRPFDENWFLRFCYYVTILVYCVHAYSAVLIFYRRVRCVWRYL